MVLDAVNFSLRLEVALFSAMSQFDQNEFSQEIIHRVSAELFRQYVRQWEAYGKFDELRGNIHLLREEVSCDDESLGAHGYNSQCSICNVKTILHEVELICDACEKILIPTLRNIKDDVTKFCESKTREAIALVEVNCSNIKVEMQGLAEENEALKRRVERDNTLYANLLEEHSKIASQVRFLEDSYIETYVELCRSKWLDVWQGLSGEVSEDYENAEAVCQMFEKTWEKAGLILCASYSAILLDLVERANEEYDTALSAEFSADDTNFIREKRNRIYNLLIQCSSRFQVLIGESQV